MPNNYVDDGRGDSPRLRPIYSPPRPSHMTLATSMNTYSTIYDTIQQEIIRINQKRATPVEAFNINAYLEDTKQLAKNDFLRLIPEHAMQLDLACSVMILLSKYLNHGAITDRYAAFLASLHRSTNLFIAIRQLLLTGFEESTRPLTRAYFESIDISLVVLTDKNLAISYFGENADFEKFWKNNLAYGRVYEHLKSVLRLCDFNEEEIEEHIISRKHQKNLLSGSVHGDDPGAFRSWAPPALGYPDMVYLQQHGVISLHTANHVAALILETYKYTSIIMKRMISGEYNDLFKRSDSNEELNTFSVHFFIFQDRIHSYPLPDGNDIIAPDYVHENIDNNG